MLEDQRIMAAKVLVTGLMDKIGGQSRYPGLFAEIERVKERANLEELNEWIELIDILVKAWTR